MTSDGPKSKGESKALSLRRRKSLDDPFVSTTNDGKKKDPRKGKRPGESKRRTSMPAVFDRQDLEDLEFPGFLLNGGFAGEQRNNTSVATEPTTFKTTVSSAGSGKSRSSVSVKSHGGCPRKSRSSIDGKRRSSSSGKRREGSTSKSRSGVDDSPSKQRSSSPGKARSFKASPDNRRSVSPGVCSTRTSTTTGTSASRSTNGSPSTPCTRVHRSKSQEDHTSPRSRVHRSRSQEDSTSPRPRVSRSKKADSSKSTLAVSPPASGPRVSRSKSQESINDIVSSLSTQLERNQSEKHRSSRRVRPKSGEKDYGTIKSTRSRVTRSSNESVGASSRTTLMRSSAGASLHSKFADLKAPDRHEVHDIKQEAHGSRMDRRLNLSSTAASPAMAAAASVLNTSTQVKRPQRRACSVQPGGRVRRNSIRSGGRDDWLATKPEHDIVVANLSPRRNSLPVLMMKGAQTAAVVAFDEASLLSFSPRKSPNRTKSLDPERIMKAPISPSKPRRTKRFGTERIMRVPSSPSKLKARSSAPHSPGVRTRSPMTESSLTPTTPSKRASKKSSPKPSGFKQHSKHKPSPTASPRGPPQNQAQYAGFAHPEQGSPRRSILHTPHKSPRSNSLTTSLTRLRPSRRTSISGGAADDTKSVVSTLSRLQRRVSLPASARAPATTISILW